MGTKWIERYDIAIIQNAVPWLYAMMIIKIECIVFKLQHAIYVHNDFSILPDSFLYTNSAFGLCTMGDGNDLRVVTLPLFLLSILSFETSMLMLMILVFSKTIRLFDGGIIHISTLIGYNFIVTVVTWSIQKNRQRTYYVHGIFLKIKIEIV